MARKKSPESNNYFTKETEDYIIKYNACTDSVEKDRIFTEHLYYPFYKLAENIIHTFKFYHTDVDQIEDLKLDVITMLIQENKLCRFDPSYGTKAYSYFGTIIKRWLIAYSNKNYNHKKNQLPMTAYQDTCGEDKHIETCPALSLSAFIDNWITDVYSDLETLFPKEMDRQIADAVLTVFRTRQDLQIFKKKALYVYIREITGCETIYLTKVVAKLKENFYNKYKSFQREGLILDENDDD